MTKYQNMRSLVEVKDNWISLDSLEEAKEQVESLGCIWHDWYYDKAIRPEMSEQYYSFWSMDENPATIQFVSPAEIVGQVHDRFEKQEPYWLALLYSITDRWKSNDLEKNKKVVERENAGNNPVRLYEINKRYYIAEGIHRAVLAKFLEMDFVRCKITHFKFDEKNFEIYERICHIIGDGTLSPKEFMSESDSVSFRWFGLLFHIWKDEESIGRFEELYRQAYNICNKRFSRLMCSIKRHFIPQPFLGASIIINHHYMRDDYLPILVNSMVEQLNCGSKLSG